MRYPVVTPCSLVLGSLLIPAPLPAVTYFVDRFDDQPAASSCSPLMLADCSLRGAVLHANGTAAADTIVLPNGVYQLTVAGALEDQAQIGDLDVLEEVTISAAMGAHPTIVQTTADRVFHLLGAAASLTFDGPLTLQSGLGTDGTGNGDGGSIYAEEGVALTLVEVTLTGASAERLGGCLFSSLNDPGDSLTLTGVILEGCSAEGGGGAFIAIDDATVLLDRVRVESCHAQRNGGGLSLLGGPALMIVQDSILRNNTAGDAGHHGSGAGVFVFTGDANVRFVGSSIVGNVSGVPGSSFSGGGGGLRIDAGSQVELRNSTLSGNRTRGPSHFSPGAEVSGTLVLDHATVADNRSEPVGERAIRLVAGTLVSEASIVEGGCSELTASSMTSQGYNVERPTDGGMTSQCGLTNPSDVFTTATVVRPLAGNGGPTPTHALAPGSPARLLVPSGSCAAEDQRHAPRSLLFCDAGSYESSGQAPGPWIFSDGYESGDSFAWSATTL
jgi:hypothetical protein